MLGTSRQLRSRGARKPASDVAGGKQENAATKKRRVFGDVSNRGQANADRKPAAKKSAVSFVPSLRRSVRSLKTVTEKALKPEPARRSHVASKRNAEGLETTRQPSQPGKEEETIAVKPRTRSRSRSKAASKSTDSDSNKSSGSKRGSSKRPASKDSKEPAAKKAKQASSQTLRKAVKPRPTKRKATKPKPTMVEKKAPRGRATTSRKTAKRSKGPRELCSDFVTDSNYTLVRKPFDSSKYTTGISEHDEMNKKKDCEVANYVTDLYQRLYHAEPQYQPHMYLQDQTEINGMMRAILVDWLIEVHMKFKLAPETLYLCVNIIDRYCSQVEVERRKLQLVGVTALLLACKYEEIYPPEVRDCVYITDRAYTRQDVLDMEQDIINVLEFRLTVPTGYNFLVRYLLVVEASDLAKAAANYYLERTLQEYDFLEYRPSLVAAAAVCLALNNPQVRAESWVNPPPVGIPDELLEYTGYSSGDIFSVGEKIVEILGEEVVTASQRQLVAVKRKYDSRKYHHVSTDVIDPEVHDLLG